MTKPLDSISAFTALSGLLLLSNGVSALADSGSMYRTLAKHKEYEETWAIQAVHLASRLGKQPEDVALSRAFKFRKRREKLDHLHKSKPVYERLPGHLYWQVSLRECHSRCADYSPSVRTPFRYV